MKCKNCGANYHLMDRQCPYCHTRNILGRIWIERTEEAQNYYDETQKHVMKTLPIRVANGLANWLIVIFIVVYILIISGVFAYFYSADKINDIQKSNNLNKITAQMEEYYTNGEYDKLYHYMDANEMFGEEYYKYSQMALLYYDYEEFLKQKQGFFQDIDNGKADREDLIYDISITLYKVSDVITADIPAYPDMDEDNKAIHQKYADDVKVFCRTMFGMSEEEVLALSQEGYTINEEGKLEQISEDDYRWGSQVYIPTDSAYIVELLEREAWK